MQELILPKQSERNAEERTLPALINHAGPAAIYAFEEFLTANIRNAHSRRTYGRAVRNFLEWCERRRLELPQITPAHVAGFLDEQRLSIVSKKVWLSALRGLFDALTLRHVVVINPAASVRGERYRAEGKTPEIARDDARRLLQSIDTSRMVGQRDRCLLAVLTYTAVRASAAAKLSIGDLLSQNQQSILRFLEKNGNERRIPVRADLETMLRSYLEESGLVHAPKTHPLFPTTEGRSDRLTNRFLSGGDVARIVKRRLKDAGLPEYLSPHSFRTAVITDLISQGVPLADVQRLAGHADPRVTQLYDRTQRTVTRNLVERISI